MYHHMRLLRTCLENQVTLRLPGGNGLHDAPMQMVTDLRARPPRSHPPAPRTRQRPPVAGLGPACAARHHQSHCHCPSCRRQNRQPNRRRCRPSCHHCPPARRKLRQRRRPHMLPRCLPHPANCCHQARLSRHRCHRLPSQLGMRPCLPGPAKRLHESCRLAWDPRGLAPGCRSGRNPTAAETCRWYLHAAMFVALALAPQLLELHEAMSRNRLPC